jgi:uncharacterized protein YdeI (BOF family)
MYPSRIPFVLVSRGGVTTRRDTIMKTLLRVLSPWFLFPAFACTTNQGDGTIASITSSQALTTDTPAVSTTIAAIVANPVQDQVVTLNGQFVECLEGNDCRFSDGTGELLAEGGPPWYQELNLPLNEPVAISCQVDVKDGNLILELFQVTLADGTVIEVRGEGRPPWAGGPNHRGGPDAGADDDD